MKLLALASLLTCVLVSPLTWVHAGPREARKDPATASYPGKPRKGIIERRALVLGRWEGPVKVTGKLEGKSMTAPVLVYLPAGYGQDPARKAPLVLVLHGWNHTPEQLRDKADLEILADRYGVVLAVPAMGKTVYESELFAESKQPWGTIPGARWVGEVILPHLRGAYAVAGDRSHTAVIGYSTGGRGAVLLAQAYPEFAFAGSLSGTFDLMRLSPRDGEYKIHAAVYGSRRKFESRWQRDNCVAPERVAQLVGTALFLGHGGKDEVVPAAQLTALQDALQDAGAKAPAVSAQVTPGAGHDWAYWNGQWPAMFEALARALGEPAARPRALPRK
ncbi:MAG TPA: alpha/beta hydrolase-fold protein [Kofleriaceae bacterium]|nr:alpha/beta hydrolase-fold protein [Kofleriaceae bacterium]